LNIIEIELSNRKDVIGMETIICSKNGLLIMRNNVIFNIRLKTAEKAKDSLEIRLARLISEEAEHEK